MTMEVAEAKKNRSARTAAPGSSLPNPVDEP
jgi:hypothetical protein